MKNVIPRHTLYSSQTADIISKYFDKTSYRFSNSGVNVGQPGYATASIFMGLIAMLYQLPTLFFVDLSSFLYGTSAYQSSLLD